MAQTYRLPMFEALLLMRLQSSSAVGGKAGAIDPHAVEDDAGAFAAMRTGVSLVPRRLATAIPHALRSKKRTGARQHHAGSFVERSAHHAITDLGDPPGHIELARLILPRRQAKVRTDIARASEARGIILRRS